MKSPGEIAQRIAREWQKDKFRDERLLGNVEWPLRYPIGRPSPKEVEGDWSRVAAHIQRWRPVSIGEVAWEDLSYRATSAAVRIPVYWDIFNPSQWVQAAADRNVSNEFATLEELLASCDTLFHTALVRQRALWKNKSLDDIKKAAQLATQLEPGCACGVPLRALPHEGIDSKFFERNRALLTRLLDARFDGEPSEQGLESFLDAQRDTDHWLLLTDLDGELLPFYQQRVRSAELSKKGLPAQRLLVVENENCVHLLPPKLPGTVAVMGAGNNLRWLEASWVNKTPVGYWGDIDTWGLVLLARARTFAPHLHSLLMDRQTFDQFADSRAVVEPVVSSETPPASLLEEERELFHHLLLSPKGRLEQEFIPKESAINQILEWWRG